MCPHPQHARARVNRPKPITDHPSYPCNRLDFALPRQLMARVSRRVCCGAAAPTKLASAPFVNDNWVHLTCATPHTHGHNSRQSGLLIHAPDHPRGEKSRTRFFQGPSHRAQEPTKQKNDHGAQQPSECPNFITRMPSFYHTLFASASEDLACNGHTNFEAKCAPTLSPL